MLRTAGKLICLVNYALNFWTNRLKTNVNDSMKFWLPFEGGELGWDINHVLGDFSSQMVHGCARFKVHCSVGSAPSSFSCQASSPPTTHTYIRISFTGLSIPPISTNLQSNHKTLTVKVQLSQPYTGRCHTFPGPSPTSLPSHN